MGALITAREQAAGRRMHRDEHRVAIRYLLKKGRTNVELIASLEDRISELEDRIIELAREMQP